MAENGLQRGDLPPAVTPSLAVLFRSSAEDLLFAHFDPDGVIPVWRRFGEEGGGPTFQQVHQ